MSDEGARIIVLGHSKKYKKDTFIHTYLKENFQKNIPCDFISSIMLTFLDGTKDTFEDLEGTLEIDNVSDILRVCGTNKGIREAKIVVELDKIQQILSDTTHSFLSKYFNN